MSKEFVYIHSEWPYEFMRDPSYWIEAEKMESFLACVEKEGHSIEAIVHRSRYLRAWGPLDSVLSMLPKPHDIVAQPDRFLSYFISPPPPVAGIAKKDDVLEFEVPISNEEFPRVTRYLRAALEALPTYVGKPLATSKWDGYRVSINWENHQEALFTTSDEKPVLDPKLVDSVVHSLEQSQKDLERKNRELMEKNQQLEEAKKQLELHFREKVFSEKLSNLSQLSVAISHEINNPMTYVVNNVQRLNDYMTRSRQIVTLLIAADKMNPAVQGAMRKVDWEFVLQDYPLLVQETVSGLFRIQDIVRDLASWAGSEKKAENERVPTDINDLVGKVLKMMESNLPSRVHVDRHLFMDRPVLAYPSRLEQALVNLLSNAVQSIDEKGTVRICTRPKGGVAEIEVADTGRGMDGETVKHIFTPFFTTRSNGKGTGLGLAITQSIVQMHNGNINVESHPGRGSTFTIELPLH